VGSGSSGIGNRAGVFASSRARSRLLLLCLGLLALSALIALPRLAAAENGDSAKEAIVAQILEQFKGLYYGDPICLCRGKTFSIVIKNFRLDDEKTYAIIDENKRFWVIDLPAKVKQAFGVAEPFIGEEFPLRQVREKFVSATRAEGLLRQFTVPISYRSP